MSWSVRFAAQWVTIGLAVTLGALILVEVTA